MLVTYQNVFKIVYNPFHFKMTPQKVKIILQFILILAMVNLLHVLIDYNSSTKNGSQKSILNFLTTENDFCKIDYIIEKRNKEFNRITLAIPASFDRINETLISKMENWDGPISLVIVFPKDAETRHFQCITKWLKNLQTNNQKAAEYLNANFLIQGNSILCDTISKEISNNNRMLDCSFPNYTSNELLNHYVNFQINLARNYARNMTKTKYILMADMEHYFSKNFEQKVLSLAEQTFNNQSLNSINTTTTKKIALVYRIFEIEEKYFKIKETKNGLKKLLEKNLAQQFHEFHHVHTIQRLVEWIYSKDLGPNTTSIQFYKPYSIFQWEPQFVALVDDGLPYHDINFKFPSSDNRNLRWEMCRAEYQFAIMNDVFMYHPGIREQNSNIIYDHARSIVHENNMLALQKFNERMDKIYPQTKYKCPNFSYV